MDSSTVPKSLEIRKKKLSMRVYELQN